MRTYCIAQGTPIQHSQHDLSGKETQKEGIYMCSHSGLILHCTAEKYNVTESIPSPTTTTIKRIGTTEKAVKEHTHFHKIYIYLP